MNPADSIEAKNTPEPPLATPDPSPPPRAPQADPLVELILSSIENADYDARTDLAVIYNLKVKAEHLAQKFIDSTKAVARYIEVVSMLANADDPIVAEVRTKIARPMMIHQQEGMAWALKIAPPEPPKDPGQGAEKA